MIAEKEVLQGVIVVTGIVEEEGDQFVAYCRELGTSTCADSLEQAFEYLEDAIEVHLAGLEEAGELDRFLRERNINITSEPLDELFLTVPLGKPMKAYPHVVPVPQPA